jgi:hypothetical protein
MVTPNDLEARRELIQNAKKLAKQYRQLTGKPLGITGEVGEFVAADLLHLELTDARNPGYDAIGPNQISLYTAKCQARPENRFNKA